MSLANQYKEDAEDVAYGSSSLINRKDWNVLTFAAVTAKATHHPQLF